MWSSTEKRETEWLWMWVNMMKKISKKKNVGLQRLESNRQNKEKIKKIKEKNKEMQIREYVAKKMQINR